MRRKRLDLLAAIALATGAIGSPALAQTKSAPQYAVVYGELAPGYAAAQQAKPLLDQLARLAAKSDGNLYFSVDQEIGRPNFFCFVEVWRDAASFAAFKAASNVQAVQASLTPLLLAPLDERDGVFVDPTK